MIEVADVRIEIRPIERDRHCEAAQQHLDAGAARKHRIRVEHAEMRDLPDIAVGRAGERSVLEPISAALIVVKQRDGRRATASWLGWIGSDTLACLPGAIVKGC